jgi:anti-anti-sigma regulatory factor
MTVSTSPLKVALTESASFTLVELSGVLDQGNTLARVLPATQRRRVLVELSGLVRISSYGVRDWTRWLTGLEERGNELFLLRVSPPMVSQANLVQGILGRAAKVLSFLTPFYCPQCSSDQVVRLEPEQVEPAAEPPPANCPQCGAPMEFDDLPDRYFAFVADQRKRPISPQALRGLRAWEQQRYAAP